MTLGYYSSIEIDTRIKEAHVQEVREKSKEAVKITSAIHEATYVDWHLGDMCIEDDGGFGYDETYQKWYGDWELVKFLAPHVEQGDIIFIGEDGVRVGYHFDGQGNIFDIQFVEKVGKLLWNKELGVAEEI